MKQKYLSYYERYSSLAHGVFLWDALRARSRVRKLSLLNRQRDYLRLRDDPERLALHRQINQCLYEAAREWGAYDYGEGYCYQSLDAIGVSGLRDTRARVEAMALPERLRGKTVLEIGCNAGFIALSLAGVAERVVAFDVNPYLIDVGWLAAAYLGITNVEFVVSSFEEFDHAEPFDAVLSFANHATYDGNTRQPIEQYFRRCSDHLKPGGLLLFESHPPEHEGDALDGVCSIIDARFAVRDRLVLEYGTFLDRGRTFIVAEQPAASPPAHQDACSSAFAAGLSP